MFSYIFNLIFFLIFAYLIIYAIYLLTMNIKALLSSKEFLVQNVPSNFDKTNLKENKICVVIFANSKSKKLENLLKTLNEQTYNKENYSVHVVFAKDSNSLLYVPDCVFGAQIHCIENPEFFKKDKALNLFIEKLVQGAKFDGFLFVGADRFVSSDYIENANIALNKFKTGVITGKTTIVTEFREISIKSKIIGARQEFKNNTLNVSRRMFELASVIDSENCILSSEVIEKTGKICFESREAELKYSLFLASNSIKPVYSPFLETFTEAASYNPATAGIQTRLSLFKYYIGLLIKKPWYFIEFVISLIQPNVAVVSILYLALLYASFRFITTIGVKYVFHLGIFYLIVWGIGLFASKLNPLKIAIFLLYPFYSFGFNFKKLTKDISKRALQRTIAEEKNIKSSTKDAIVTDGKKNVFCKMDLMTEDGMRRVVLRFRKKRVISEGCIRMYDALSDISKRITTHGYALKICQNCKHFESLQDGTVDLLRGVCKINSSNSENHSDTIIWNRCANFLIKNESSVFEDLNQDKE